MSPKDFLDCFDSGNRSMSLPNLIEIVPLDKPVHAEITVPGSKSITNRALVLAALAEGETTLQGALWSEDTEVMVECLQELGYMVNVAPDPNEFCNRTVTVYGLSGKVPRGGTIEQPLELFVGNAGTAARFLAAMVCLGEGVYRLHGVPRMHERPQAALFQAMRELGYRVDAPNDKLPALIHGAGPKPGSKCSVSIEDSSQFASALLLGANGGGWLVTITGENAEESPYVAMTSELIKVFPERGGKFQIEPDASSGSYFWAAGWLTSIPRIKCEKTKDGISISIPTQVLASVVIHNTVDGTERTDPDVAFGTEGFCTVSVRSWPDSGWQIDSQFPKFLPLPNTISRAHQLGDGIMTSIVVAADQDGGREWQPIRSGNRTGRIAKMGSGSIAFENLGRLRVQECERVVALRTELTKCGAKVIETGDTLEVFPSQLHGAEIETYNDHRMAMCFAILGLKVPGIKIKNPACVKKTFPNFFQKLAAAPPLGLGARILDASGRPLTHEELFAE
jgi:3-phosphoshikimate 1-carboxyvinyltransferase